MASIRHQWSVIVASVLCAASMLSLGLSTSTSSTMQVRFRSGLESPVNAGCPDADRLGRAVPGSVGGGLRVLLAGASGALGIPIARQLVANGHTVLGLIHDPAHSEALVALGA